MSEKDILLASVIGEQAWIETVEQDGTVTRAPITIKEYEALGVKGAKPLAANQIAARGHLFDTPSGYAEDGMVFETAKVEPATDKDPEQVILLGQKVIAITNSDGVMQGYNVPSDILTATVEIAPGVIVEDGKVVKT